MVHQWRRVPSAAQRVVEDSFLRSAHAPPVRTTCRQDEEDEQPMNTVEDLIAAFRSGKFQPRQRRDRQPQGARGPGSNCRSSPIILPRLWQGGGTVPPERRGQNQPHKPTTDDNPRTEARTRDASLSHLRPCASHGINGRAADKATKLLRSATPVGFEPTRGYPIGLAGRRLNHSAKVSSKPPAI